MKTILKNTINTIRGNLNLKKLLALTLGVGLLASSFVLGMTFEGRDKSKSAQAYEAENEKNSDDDANLDNQEQSGQTADATSSATINATNPNTAVSNSANGNGTIATSVQEQQFTLATLAAYNGKNNAKAYIAYNSKIYDVTNSTYFVNGAHKYDLSIKAGTDITAQMAQAPSSHTTRNYIATLPQVGVLVKVITQSTSSSSPQLQAGTSGNSQIGSGNSQTASSAITPSSSPQMQQFTLATLAVYNGKNNAKAYIAYNSKIYDVTNSTYFVNGAHKYDLSIKAGSDITAQMAQAPSSHTTRNYIATLPQVGVLVAVITNPSAGVSNPPIVITPATTIAPIGDDDDDDEEEDDD